MKVVVSGSRSIIDYQEVKQILDENKNDISILVEGNAPGVDRLARKWAIENNIKYKTVPANWKENPRGAGIKRNEKMINDGAELVIAIWDGKSNGTHHAKEYAKSIGVETREYTRKVIYDKQITNERNSDSGQEVQSL